MQGRKIWAYIKMGSGLRYLQDAVPGRKVHGRGFVLENINWFFASCQEFALPVTERAATKLRELGDSLRQRPEGATLDASDAKALGKAVAELRTTLEAEASGRIAYVVTDKRLNVVRLLEDMPALFRHDAFAKLPSIAQHDLIEAGKCIAFERPTAAAFHTLRATEAVLRAFYHHNVRRGRLKQPMWGPIVDSLRGRRAPPPRELLDNLDNIRQSFRNPTQHPEKIYDIDEAQDLFSLCADAIGRMAQSLPTRSDLPAT